MNGRSGDQASRGSKEKTLLKHQLEAMYHVGRVTKDGRVGDLHSRSLFTKAKE